MNSRLRAILIFIPLVVDCFFNFLHGGSFRHTLSGEAWRNRDHKWWGWTHEAIDSLFSIFGQKNHCEKAAWTEAQWGSIWAAWAANFD